MQPTGVLETSKATNPLKALLELWTVDVARLHPARSAHERQTEKDDRRGWPSRDDFESFDLREGDRRQFALRRHVEVAGFAQRSGHDRPLRADCDSRHSRRRRYSASGV